MEYLKVRWAGYGFLPYIVGIVDNKGKKSFNEWYISIPFFKENFTNYSNWDSYPYIELLK